MLGMLDIGTFVLWLILAILLVGLLLLVRSHFGAEAKARRRRDKSHRPIVSTKRGPTVKLAVNVDRTKDGGKG